MLKRVTEKSKCCNAKVKVIGKVTMHYVCLKCKNPCDVRFVERKTWEKNPVTKVMKSKKIYNRRRNKTQLKKENRNG